MSLLKILSTTNKYNKKMIDIRCVEGLNVRVTVSIFSVGLAGPDLEWKLYSSFGNSLGVTCSCMRKATHE